jgi:hypothetical protein
MKATGATKEWAGRVFGGAQCGDRRLNDRLVSVAAAAASCPAGTVTAVIVPGAEREGAFRLLENSHVCAQTVSDAMCVSSVCACEDKYVFVAIDGCSLRLTDRVGGREVGGVGAWSQNGRGLQVVSALAVSWDGTPIGLVGQTFWARNKRKEKYRERHSMEMETRYGVELLREVHGRFLEYNPEVTPWFQLDRGYDVWPVLLEAVRNKMLITVRAVYDRIVRQSRNEPKQYLIELAHAAPVLGTYRLQIPARPGRPARLAQMQVQARTVTLELHTSSKHVDYVTINVVLTKECSGDKPLTWMLLTTAPVDCLDDAMTVIAGYTTRWRIEEFHRAWKKGGCNVEDNQLRTHPAIVKWATILAAVAARAIRLTYLAREKPDLSALEELSRDEIDGIIALLQPKGVKKGAKPTLVVAVGWIADLGGFAGKYSGKPPGPTVVARGLQKVEIAADVLKNMRKK